MGLLKTGLKAAVAVKTADVIHERILQRQQAQYATYGQPAGMIPPGAPAPTQAPPTLSDVSAGPAAVVPAAAAPAAVDTGSMLAQLTQLGELRAAGVLSDAEFEVQKARILG
ncbi:MAG: SHOCT domain-containing protein [Solirubrobacteraceae bacterium]